MKEKYDAIVLGARCAGSPTAMLLARKGHRVLVGSQFEQAVIDSKSLPDRPNNSTLLNLYALYKQGTEGDVAGNPPDSNDFVVRAKWDAWSALKGTPVEQAQQAYVDLIESLKSRD